ncbi:MAG: glycosyltransferase [Candidatus Limnocylindrales bacterium]
MVDPVPLVATALPRDVSLLIVATIATTLRSFLLPYAAHFRALGWRVDAAASAAAGDSTLGRAFDHVYELPLSRSIVDVGGILRSERAMAGILEAGYDLVHVHTPIASLVTRIAVRRMPAARRPALAYTAHGFHFHKDGSAATNALFVTAERTAGRWTDRLVVINDEDFEAARRHRIVPTSRLVRMPGIGIDTAFYARSELDPDEIRRARDEFGGGPDVPFFVVVAELNANKRNADVIEALALVADRRARLVILGDGPERPGLEALAERLGVRDRVHLAGFIRDVRPVIASADALVLASYREGLARSIMEALALEVPVIASTARGNRELVGPDSGIVVPVGDPRALAAAMDRLIDDPEESRRMGARGRARMIERFDVQAVIRDHEAMYRSMLADRAGS